MLYGKKYCKIYNMNNKNWGNLYIINNNAQNSFTAFYDFFLENIFPEKSIEIKYKNRHSWMPISLLKSIKTNHVLYKLSITKPTKINQATYKNNNNKLNSIKRKAERDHYSNQGRIKVAWGPWLELRKGPHL